VLAMWGTQSNREARGSEEVRGRFVESWRLRLPGWSFVFRSKQTSGEMVRTGHGLSSGADGMMALSELYATVGSNLKRVSVTGVPTHDLAIFTD
jgi:hypothetical protein